MNAEVQATVFPSVKCKPEHRSVCSITTSLVSKITVILGLGLSVALPIHADQVLNLNIFIPTASVPLCKVNLGGDHAETFPQGVGQDCTSTLLEPVLANVTSPFLVGNFDGPPPTTQTFGTAFANWNTTSGGKFGGNWVVVDGGDLNVTFNVIDIAYADKTVGGIKPIIVRFTMNPGYVGPNIRQLVWTQAVYASYDPSGAVDLDPPANTLDTASFSGVKKCVPLPGQHPGPFNSKPANIPAGTPYCDPIYPTQHPEKPFADAPRGPWPDESFRAIALLSTVTFFTDENGDIWKRQLTVYNGVSYGFDLSATPTGAPEPTALLLFGSGILGLGGFLRKRLLS